jgi:pyoverdine/dityrosine biosynthesis protein Dit1
MYVAPDADLSSRVGHDACLDISWEILRILHAYRRGTLETASTQLAERQHATAYGAPQLAKLLSRVRANVPIVFTLPAFPCKSPNPNKVLGLLPDMAERLSLRFLARLCSEIGRVYAAGAKILLCSDGHVFSDLIDVDDAVVDAYSHALTKLIEQESIGCIDVFQLGQIHGQLDYTIKRQRLTDEWGQPLAQLREQIVADEANLSLYRGITRFLYEDTEASTWQSKSALQRASRRRAYGVIQRSQAWGNLIAAYHPDAVRLSIHPQPAHSSKLGIMLLEADDQWLTPWHGVAVECAHGAILMKRVDAQRIGRLVHAAGHPSHYIARGDVAESTGMPLLKA